ncbi:hypothetical protein J6590_028974 [Homalodisca vitripennis]|nr:hypothetical protein J6590_028974 [Homalodisca vitripennis]
MRKASRVVSIVETVSSAHGQFQHSHSYRVSDLCHIIEPMTRFGFIVVILVSLNRTVGQLIMPDCYYFIQSLLNWG